MNLRRFTATSILVVAAMGVGAATAYADPAVAPQPGAEQGIPNINYQTARDGDAAVATLDAGAFSINAAAGTVDVIDDGGRVVASIPTFFRVDDLQHPFEVAVDASRSVLRLVPDMDPAAATPVPVSERLTLDDVAAPVDKAERDDRALDDFQQQLGITTAITAIVAAIIGGAIGCAVGVIPGTAALVVPFLGLAGPVAGCIGGALIVAPVVALAGTIVVGGGALVVLGIQYFNTINSPFVAPAPAA
ncbi:MULTISPECIES: hypothetical protein [unclassified Rhodococcus (in: high G+C Gram-positive bacteria)]|uniref:hypothetical protein n=1 Tax=unclassified Rhodococcus (in: high G+C Gram-positive bacteria) TaxID=192944 RepID=UPI001639C983|nr:MULTISPECIES: hypothetical protein [unclassified Rhodococcus (in: high G+C Gram-positive bacteria)]MBC2642752.1 hypothetical protein [Rhodococcus sp. 3A]MBC2892506.1 hypothetical protein [Rhodococcus sp. 4CII]